MTAPNFKDSKYPGAGKLIGPAWQMMWDFLEGRAIPVSRATIAEAAIGETLEIHPKTIAGLLSGAARAGLLERTHKGRRKMAHYRRIDAIPTLEEEEK